MERTIYALEAPGLHGDGAPENSVEALAALYLEVVRGHRPGGPYFLCGWSFGGVVAYEMARLLVERGERVGLLALIDSRAPGSTPVSSDPVDGRTLVEMLARELGGPSGDGAGRMTSGESPGPATDDPLERVVQKARERGLLPRDIGTQEIHRLLKVLRANFEALRGYLPGPYAGRVTLFRAAQATTIHPDPAFGWRELAAGGVDVHEVPGDHHSLIREPHVGVLVERLRGSLDAAGRAIGAGSERAGRSEDLGL